jgi:X-Pro dipeptidyl-peptidase (S15 family)
MSASSHRPISLRPSAMGNTDDGLWEEQGMTDTGGIFVERDLMVPARDGVLLATDVYRPDGPGPFPALLERTPYDKSAPSRSERSAADARPRSRTELAAYFVGHGYAVAYQDCRGRYHSGGRFTKYLAEAEDGFDTLAGCNASLGAMAASALSVSPTPPTRRRRSAASTRPGWRRNFSIAAASPTPTAAVSAMAAPST